MIGLLLPVTLLAGALGAVLRYLVARAAPRASWPWPVLVVNVAGSLVAGLAAHSDLRLLVVSGFAGGLTTFSTLGVETIQLLLERRVRAAALSIGGNLVLGGVAAAVGWGIGALLFP